MREAQPSDLIDAFGRHISYVRLSVTDRCDLRCRYCMAEEMRFLPKRDVLSFEEIEALADILIARGVRRIRLTGGEPLVRREIGALVERLGARLGDGLDELTLTTNGTRLVRFAGLLHAAGISAPFSAESPRRRPPAWRSRSTWSRSRGSTRTRSPTCSPGAARKASISP